METTVFAMDQDNRNFDLTRAIWGGGALTPTAAEIVSTIKGEPLTPDGFVSSEFWVSTSCIGVAHISYRT